MILNVLLKLEEKMRQSFKQVWDRTLQGNGLMGISMIGISGCVMDNIVPEQCVTILYWLTRGDHAKWI